jgi:molybdate transport system ATP-binding protein
VALARALAAKPELLLLDEPLGALDAQTAPEIRQVLRTHIRAGSLTTLLVTHDVLDAATLADRVIVLEDGVIVDSGPTARVLAAPKSSFTAALAGLNMVPGVTLSAAEPGDVAALAAPREFASGGVDPTRGAAVSGVAAESLAAGAQAIAVFPPSAVAVYLEPAAGSPRNTWPATVVALEPGPSAIRVRARRSGGAPADGDETQRDVLPDGMTIAADLTPAAVAELGLQPGIAVHLTVKANEVRVHAR